MKRLLAILFIFSMLSITHAATYELVINELMAANAGVAMSPATNFDSWIELYNPTSKAVNLAGMYLSDDINNLERWQMPNDIGTVPAKGFLVVWLGSDDIKANQAPFKLDCDGGTICLSDPNAQLIARVDYPKALSRISWARTTDGGNEWKWTADATPGATNATAVFATTRLNAPVVSVGSQLINGSLSFHVDIPEGAILMYSTNGTVPTEVSDESTEPEEPTWTNWIKNGDCEGTDVSCLVSKNGNEGGKLNTYILEGVGYNGSRGIRIQSIDNPENEWDTQFFVYTPDHIWNAGDKYRFSMKVRAERADHITPQSQRTPGSYIHWQMMNGGFNVGTEWKEYNYEGTITAEQAGDGAMQTIAFHLNESAAANVFYFDDIVWESYQDEGSTTSSCKRSKDGQFTVSRTTCFVFRLFKNGYLPSVPVSRSFILTSNNYTIPIVSIIGDDRYFNDAMWGIDVKGNNGISGNGSDDPVNWNQPWDRPVNFSYISPTEGMLLNQDVNISVSGGWSRTNSPRSFKLKSSKIFDGQNHLDYPFFPQKPYIRSKTLLVRNGGNDSYARFMDPALTTIVQRSGIDLDVQSMVQVAEYVNGRFKGVLNLREPNNDKFVYANYGYDDEEIDMFENGTFKNGNKEVYNQLVTLSEQVNDEGIYEQIKTLLDIDEFTNYMAAELFLGNDDWPNNNVKAYRSRQDGRFRFILFDLDQPFNAWGHTISSLDDFNNVKMVRLFKNLLKHNEYRKKFIDTICILAGSVFEKERAIAIVDELADAMRPMQKLDNRNPDGTASIIKNKLNNRLEEVINQLRQYQPLQLSSVMKRSVQLTSDVANACIAINDIAVPYADFNGYIFGAATLKATAPAGYRFTGWKKNGNLISTNEEINMPLGSNNIISANFTALNDSERESQGITPICINEVSANNDIYVNEYFKRNDWVELYNTTDQPIDIEGMYLSDDENNPRKYQIGSMDSPNNNTIVPAHGYIIIWCDKLQAQSQLHASFKLAAEGGTIVLTAADESWSNRLTYTAMKGDETVGRYPDGTNTVITMNVPTIAKANITSSYATTVEQPAPSGIIDHSMILSQEDSSQLYNLKGQAVQGRLKPGIYIKNGRKIIVKD